jgi:hypothetical protein
MKMSAADMNLLMVLPLTCVAVASALMALLLWLRQPRKFQNYQDGTGQPGIAFDATRIAPRINRLRKDYTTALHSVPHPLLHTAASVAAARMAIREMAYFRDSEVYQDRE